MDRLGESVTARLIPLLMAAALLGIVSQWGSNVPLSVFSVRGGLVDAVAVVYAGILLFWAVFPDRYRSGHVWAGGLAVFVLAGRAGGFLELALDRESLGLTSAILERAVTALLMFRWHLRRLLDPGGVTYVATP